MTQPSPNSSRKVLEDSAFREYFDFCLNIWGSYYFLTTKLLPELKKRFPNPNLPNPKPDEEK